MCLNSFSGGFDVSLCFKQVFTRVSFFPFLGETPASLAPVDPQKAISALGGSGAHLCGWHLLGAPRVSGETGLQTATEGCAQLDAWRMFLE